MSNLDDFDQAPEHFEGDDHEQAATQRSGLGKSVAAAWQASPVFKIFLLLVGGGAIASAALGVFSSDKAPPEKSVVGQSSNVTATPGGEAPPAFQEAVNEASRQRVQGAMQTGGSALPTPMGNTTQMTQLDPSAQQSNDPLAEFRAQKNVGSQNLPAAANGAPANGQTTTQVQTQVTAPVEPQLDQGLAQAMQQQMQQLVSSWQPQNGKIINVAANKSAAAGGSDGAAGGSGTSNGTTAVDRGKALVSAGTINYGQMAIEANSDVPGPIMAQVLSGPLSGGRAIGQFQSTDDYLIIKFTTISYKGRDYPVNALALNPDTTLGGMATETDQRYFSRMILPAAAQFVSGFAEAFAEGDTNVTIQDGVVVSQRTGNALRRGFGQGFEGAGQQISSIMSQEASKIRPLVRVAAGTPIGIFFVSSVFEKDPEILAQQQAASGKNGLPGTLNGFSGTGQNGTNGNGQNGYNPYGQTGNYGQNPYNTQGNSSNSFNNPYGGLNNGSTSTNYGGYNGNGVTIIPTNGTGTPTVINTR